jgi:hypothetical protein
MALTLPDTANLGDPGHITDHNLITTALGSLETSLAAKAPSANPTFTGTVALPSTTTLNGVTLSAGGWTYITSATISAANSTIISSCFSATYDVYKIYIDNLLTSADGINVLLQLRTGSTTANTNYNYQVLQTTGTSVAGSRTTASTSALVNQGGTAGSPCEITLYGPFLARATTGTSFTGFKVAGTTLTLDTYTFSHTTATSYESLVLSSSSGTMSGTARIYGLKNS